LALMAAVAAPVCFAADSTPPPSSARAALAGTPILHLVEKPKANPYLGAVKDQNDVPKSVYEKYAKIVASAVSAGSPSKALTPHMRAFIDAQRNQAVAEVSAEKQEALKQLGVSAKGTGTLYILVSSSMPKKMLREYAAQAIYTGAVLDFRGVLADKPYPLTWFLKHEILPLLSLNKNARPTVTIDPRPFNVWNVHSVPTIVYTTVPNERLCPKQIIHDTWAVNDANKRVEVPYHVCAAMPAKDYWEIQGPVTLRYALRKFIGDGAASAKPLLEALDKGQFPQGKTIVGIKKSAYAKLQTPGGIDALMNMLHQEGYEAFDAQAQKLWNPGDFARASGNSVEKALSSTGGN
jgi:hypothetical protein